MPVKIIGELTDDGETVLLSLYSDKVKAGFPSPATDYVQNCIDLNTLLIPPSRINLSGRGRRR
ncbi:hypothetical protein [Psychrobacter cryohalolentis]|uniref:hypothetical protein n=1 Tax=Psychrobacter cryohalolentis TaxID=330922 RepID=UPI0002D3202B|nr:hypothetical protein [Psychrobacter cryohalolentis]|tara:strand:- start:1294 stop:1482 length:189 start_codon:yes stop_codon:yes gene_type:complete